MQILALAGIMMVNVIILSKIKIKIDIMNRVATVREKSGKNKNFSRSGKSQGILQKVRENLSSCQSQ